MSDIGQLMRELFEHIRENKEWWLIPVVLAIIIAWLLITTAGQSTVPVFVYPLA